MSSSTSFAPTRSDIRSSSPVVSDTSSILTENSRVYLPPWRRVPQAAVGSNAGHFPLASMPGTKGGNAAPSPPASSLRFLSCPSYVLADAPRSSLSAPRRATPRELVHFFTPDVGFPLGKIPLSEIPAYFQPRFTHATAVGSYKWIAVESGRPTIAVPGVPDRWVRQRENAVGQVRRDAELLENVEYADYGASQVPPGMSPMEPIFHSLVSPCVLNDVQLITSRTNLLTLFSYFLTLDASNLAPGPSKRAETPRYKVTPRWRINASVLPGTQTVLLQRWEPNQRFAKEKPQSWHLAYHEAMTEAELVGSHRTPGCHQLVKYEFCGLKMLVRFNADAYDPTLTVGEEAEEMMPQNEPSGWSFQSECGSEATSIISDSTTASLNAAPAADPKGKGREILVPRIIKPVLPADLYLPPAARAKVGLGIISSYLPPVSQSNLINLKTRGLPANSPAEPSTQFDDVNDLKFIAEMYAQTLFAQMPYLYVAQHKLGDFQNRPPLKLQKDGPRMRALGAEFRGVLGRVRGMLAKMIHLTRTAGDLTFIGDGEQGVTVYRWTGAEGLSEVAMKVIQAGASSRGMERQMSEVSNFESADARYQ